MCEGDHEQTWRSSPAAFFKGSSLLRVSWRVVDQVHFLSTRLLHGMSFQHTYVQRKACRFLNLDSRRTFLTLTYTFNIHWWRFCFVCFKPDSWLWNMRRPCVLWRFADQFHHHASLPCSVCTLFPHFMLVFFSIPVLWEYICILNVKLGGELISKTLSCIRPIISTSRIDF